MSTKTVIEKTISTPPSKTSKTKSKSRNTSTQTVTKIQRVIRPRNVSNGNRRYARRRRYRNPTYNTTQNSQQSRIEHFVQEFPVTTDNTGLYDNAILFCPSKWIQARIGHLARLYQGWRPRDLRITYIPYAATVESGSITVGTIWNGNRTYSGQDSDQYVSVLTQTPGSFSTSIYRRYSSVVKCGTSLRTNIFPTSQINEDEIPFNILIYTKCSVHSATIGKIVLSGHIQFVGASVTGAAPASYSGKITFTHTDNPDQTTFTLPVDTLSTVADGTDYKFQAATPLYGANNSIILRRLSTFIATIKTVADGIATFLVDKTFPSGALPVNLIGLSSNF